MLAGADVCLAEARKEAKASALAVGQDHIKQEQKGAHPVSAKLVQHEQNGAVSVAKKERDVGLGLKFLHCFDLKDLTQGCQSRLNHRLRWTRRWPFWRPPLEQVRLLDLSALTICQNHYQHHCLRVQQQRLRLRVAHLISQCRQLLAKHQLHRCKSMTLWWAGKSKLLMKSLAVCKSNALVTWTCHWTV